MTKTCQFVLCIFFFFADTKHADSTEGCSPADIGCNSHHNHKCLHFVSSIILVYVWDLFAFVLYLQIYLLFNWNSKPHTHQCGSHSLLLMISILFILFKAASSSFFSVCLHIIFLSVCLRATAAVCVGVCMCGGQPRRTQLKLLEFPADFSGS